MLNVEQVAHRYEISRRTVFRKVELGHLPPPDTTRPMTWKPATLEAWDAGRETADAAAGEQVQPPYRFRRGRAPRIRNVYTRDQLTAVVCRDLGREPADVDWRVDVHLRRQGVTPDIRVNISATETLLCYGGDVADWLVNELVSNDVDTLHRETLWSKQLGDERRAELAALREQTLAGNGCAGPAPVDLPD